MVLNGNKKIVYLFAGLVLLVPVFLFLQKNYVFKSGEVKRVEFGNERVVQEDRKIIQDKKEVRILFVGDMMLDRYIRNRSEAQNDPCYSFIKIGDFLRSFDAVVGNNEGAITANASVSAATTPENPNHFKFTFSSEAARCYAENNIKAVSLGNNHSLNFGRDGILSTISALKEAGVKYFGDPLSEAGNSYQLNVDSVKLGLVSYNYAGGVEIETVLRQVEEMKKSADKVIVFAHWGNEYETSGNEKQRQLARSFVDAGADAVIGMHPHVIQDEEIYNGKQIFYSLGNFIFDQYFSGEVKRGLGVEMIIAGDELEFKKHYFENSAKGYVQIAN